MKTLHLPENYLVRDPVLAAFADALRGNPASLLKVLDIALAGDTFVRFFLLVWQR